MPLPKDLPLPLPGKRISRRRVASATTPKLVTRRLSESTRTSGANPDTRLMFSATVLRRTATTIDVSPISTAYVNAQRTSDASTCSRCMTADLRPKLLTRLRMLISTPAAAT